MVVASKQEQFKSGGKRELCEFESMRAFVNAVSQGNERLSRGVFVNAFTRDWFAFPTLRFAQAVVNASLHTRSTHFQSFLDMVVREC